MTVDEHIEACLATQKAWEATTWGDSTGQALEKQDAAYIAAVPVLIAEIDRLRILESELNTWLDVYTKPQTGMGSGIGVATFPNLHPAACKHMAMLLGRTR